MDKLRCEIKREPLRLGIISTASINYLAILSVIQKINGIVVQAVASRNRIKAEEYANKQFIPQAYGSYEEMLEMPFIDCVYISLPNSMHAKWAIKALESGKHVLCEKPMATCKEEAQQLLEAQNKSGKILMEAMHYRYHPVLLKVEEIIRNGEIGKVVEVNSAFCQWLPVSNHVRYEKDLKGGVLLDMGCYTIDSVRFIFNLDNLLSGNCIFNLDKSPVTIIKAKMKMLKTGVDCSTQASLLFSNDVRASIYVSYEHYFPIEISVKGTKGSLYLFSPFAPVFPISKFFNLPLYQLWIKKAFKTYPIIIFPLETTYYYQLTAFRDFIIYGNKPKTSPEECLLNTMIIDEIREKAKKV